VLFMLVMVEVVRLVIIYLSEHRVAVDFMVDLGIISTLREVGSWRYRAGLAASCGHDRVPSRARRVASVWRPARFRNGPRNPRG
jgi:hypothetical protein